MPRHRTSISLALLICAAALDLVACGSGNTAHSAASLTTNSTSSPTTASTTSSKESSVATTPCAVSQLSVSSTKSDEALNNVGVVYVLHNTSSTTCVLQGYPRLATVTTAGETTNLNAKREGGSGYLYPAVSQALVTLAPGGVASFWVEFSPLRSCEPSGEIEITPPNSHGHLTVSNHEILPCSSHFEVSPVGKGTVQPTAAG